MMLNKHIVVFADGYPTKDDPSFAFIQPVVHGFADAGLTCTVISPQSITRAFARNKEMIPYQTVDRTNKGKKISILRPKYISLSAISVCGVPISAILQRLACKRAFKRVDNPDIVYGHFWKMAANAGRASRQRLPLFAASGESDIGKNISYRLSSVKKDLGSLEGVVFVSTKNRNESERLGLYDGKTPCIVAPNGYNPEEFYQIDKARIRKKLGFDDKFTIIYVGAFNDRKGVLRVAEALRTLGDVNSIFVGSGSCQPECDGIQFLGKVPHDELVLYLNCADCFVLPTLAEGCCNAIVEALACGLPIISSNLSFNDDILNADNSIRIDPNSVEELTTAIKLLHDNEDMRQRLSLGALKSAKELVIGQRVDRIIKLIKDGCDY